MEEELYQTLKAGITLIFGITIGYMVIKKLLFTAMKYGYITFNWASATPQGKISMIILSGLGVLGVIAIFVAFGYGIKFKKKESDTKRME